MRKIIGADVLRDLTEYYRADEVQAERRKDNETISRQLAKIADMGNQQDALGKKITELQARIASLEAELEAYRAKVQRLIAAAKMVEPAIDVLNGRRVDVSSPMEMLTAWNGVFSACENLNQAIAEVENE